MSHEAGSAEGEAGLDLGHGAEQHRAAGKVAAQPILDADGGALDALGGGGGVGGGDRGDGGVKGVGGLITPYAEGAQPEEGLALPRGGEGGRRRRREE